MLSLRVFEIKRDQASGGSGRGKGGEEAKARDKEKRKVQIALQHGVAETEDPDGYVFASGTKRSL